MKFSTSAILLSLGMLVASPKAVLPNPCSDGREEGKEAAEDLWSDHYNEECDDVFLFEDKCKKDLIKDEYKSRSGDNAKEKAFKKCARDGVRRVIDDKLGECLDPEECDDLGELAAAMIINDFCAINKKKLLKKNHKKECRDEATIKCKGHLYTALKDLLDGGDSCPVIDDDASKFREHKKKLRKKCRKTVKSLT